MLRAKNAFAKIRFDEEQKQQQIFGLEAENARQELETQRWRNRNYIALLLGMLILLGIIFFIYYLRQKYKREKVREVHRTESRISKRIHDELANDVYNVMSSLEAVAPTEAVDKLEYIYKRTRDISRENSEIETGKDFSAGLLSMLSNTTGKARLIIKGEAAVNWNKISEEKKIVIYRVLQELMVNMKKHSEAQLVALSFSENAKQLEIGYSDTGKGASPAILKSGGGINNMRTRLSSVNGEISFKVEEGKGLKAELHIPV
jgi:signal transduction histidine kinase